MAYKRLGAVEVVAATTWTNIYTVPGSKYAIVSTLHILNKHATQDVTIRVCHKDNGVALEDYILYDEPISAVKGNNRISIQLGICMEVGHDLQIYCSHADCINAIAWGEEGDA